MRKSLRNKSLACLLALSMLATSFGSIFALPAYAATTDISTEEVVQKEDSSANTILAGIVAIGLIAALSSHGNSPDKSSAPPKPTTTPSPQNPGKATVSAAGEAQALSLLNQDRAASGLPALKANSQLTRLAENYALDMIKRGYFSHYSPEGQSPFDRMNQAGISYQTAGENLAQNVSVTAAEKAFMNSSGHRANILNSSFTEVGIGVVHSPDGSVYVVQEFIGK